MQQSLEDLESSTDLPIACQICLSLVKDPAICPNRHVFCYSCLKVWLEKNSKCPACRCDLDKDVSSLRIIGGFSINEEKCAEEDNLASKHMRRTRLELLYNEYEERMETLEDEIDVLRREKDRLEVLLKANGLVTNVEDGESADANENLIIALNTKLNEVSESYQNSLTEIEALKMTQDKLKDEKQDLTMQCNKLRMEVCSRSPMRFGRYTVAALEAQVDLGAKEVAQLRKALDKSDIYIRRLKSKIHNYETMCGDCDNCKLLSPSAEPSDTDSSSSNSSPEVSPSIKTPDSQNFYGKSPSHIQLEFVGNSDDLPKTPNTPLANLTLASEGAAMGSARKKLKFERQKCHVNEPSSPRNS